MACRPTCLSPECCNNQKLLLEYEKYQELQLKSQRMQEEYEKQLRDNDETKSQALEELTEFYEAKLQEKTTLLEEVMGDPSSMSLSERQDSTDRLAGGGVIRAAHLFSRLPGSYCVPHSLYPGSPVRAQGARSLPSRQSHLVRGEV